MPPAGIVKRLSYRPMVTDSYAYHSWVLEELARHGLSPRATTPPQMLRDVIRELYRHEIKRARRDLLAGRIERRRYAAHIVELRRRYPLLSIPTELWLRQVDTAESNPTSLGGPGGSRSKDHA